MPNPALIDLHRKGFAEGLTTVTREGETLDAGIDFAVVRLAAGGRWSPEVEPKETAWLLLSGTATFTIEGGTARVQRQSLFDEGPSCLHAGPFTGVDVKAETACEFARLQAANTKTFPTRLFRPVDVKPEYRGKGLVQDAALRNVRLIFDWNNPPESNLVLGEVVNFPGRWSSYPPHHHPQPEIYHYRFTKPQGYGHGELGDEVLRVRHFDTLKILGGVGHAQAAAPGYGMYYIWAVRHLENNPYRGFHFGPDHEWTLDPKQQGWVPGACP